MNRIHLDKIKSYESPPRIVNIFENNIKRLINAKHVVAVGSGTDAIFLSLKCLDIKVFSPPQES